MDQGSFYELNGIHAGKGDQYWALVICSRLNFLLSKSTHNTELQISEWSNNKK